RGSAASRRATPSARPTTTAASDWSAAGSNASAGNRASGSRVVGLIGCSLVGAADRPVTRPGLPWPRWLGGEGRIAPLRPVRPVAVAGVPVPAVRFVIEVAPLHPVGKFAPPEPQIPRVRGERAQSVDGLAGDVLAVARDDDDVAEDQDVEVVDAAADA